METRLVENDKIEDDLIPEPLRSDADTSESQNEAKWVMVQVRTARTERATMEALQNFGFQVHMPTMIERKKAKPGKEAKIVEVPKFSKYLFVWVSPDQKTDLELKAKGEDPALGKLIANVLPVPDSDTLTSDFRQQLGDAITTRDVPMQNFVGRTAKISSGPFEDMEGEITDQQCRHGEIVFTIELKVFNRTTPVDVSESDIEFPE